MKNDYILLQAQITRKLHSKIVKIAEDEERTLASWVRVTLSKAAKK